MQKWGIRGRVVGSLIVMGSLLDSRPPALAAADEVQRGDHSRSPAAASASRQSRGN